MKERTPAWLNKAIFYQIYPQSFYDSNADGIGDIPGITQKLDYLSSLGINAIWINPCFVSPFGDAGYDVADYYRVAPRYGTNQDLEQLFVEAKAHGIRVLLDLVAGHTSIEHHWFKESQKHESNPYSDYYIWNNSVWEAPQADLPIERGLSERDAAYVTNFFQFQPALNYGFASENSQFPWMQPVDAPGPQKVRQEIKNIMQFWLDKGADGFRVDMAASLVKRDADKKETSRFWRSIRQWLDENYPEAVLYAEWGDPAKSIHAGFHADYLLGFTNPGWVSLLRKRGEGHFRDPYGWSFFDESGHGDIYQFLDEYLHHYQATHKIGHIAIATGNHDESPRLADGRDLRQLKLFYLFLLTMPGTPYIYYGDEIGMRWLDIPSKEGGYGRTGSRTPMQWSDDINAGFSTAPAEELYLPIDPSPSRPNVAAQLNDPHSLLSRVRSLTQLKLSLPALDGDSDFNVVYAEPGKLPFVYTRVKDDQRVLVAINPAGYPVQVDLPSDTASNDPVAIDVPEGASFTHQDSGWNLQVPPVSGVIYRID